MKRAKPPKRNSKQLTKTLLALSLAACVFFAPLLSSFYIISHANHNHNYAEPDGSCTACAHLQFAESLLKQVSAFVKTLSFITTGIISTTAFLYVVSSFYGCQTLVKLKTRMDS